MFVTFNAVNPEFVNYDELVRYQDYHKARGEKNILDSRDDGELVPRQGRLQQLSSCMISS